MFRRRHAAVLAAIEALEGRRMLAADASVPGWKITGVSVANTEVTAGEPLTGVTYDVAPIAGGDSAKDLNVWFALSSDDVAGNADDLQIGATGGEATAGTVRVPTGLATWSDLAPGTYRLVATLTDPGNEPYGSIVGPEIHVTAGGLPDVKATDVWVGGFVQYIGPYLVGGTIQVGVDATTTEFWNRSVPARIALSADDVAGNADDIVLGNVNAFATGHDYRLAVCFPIGQPLTIPQGTPPGEYHLVAVLDPDDQLAEADETNNVIVGKTVKVELPSDYLGAWSVTRIGLGGGEVHAGGKLLVTNVDLAPGEHANDGLSQVVLDFALSRQDATGNVDDIPLGHRVIPAQAGTADLSAAFDLPLTMAPGTYRLVVKVGGTNDANREYAPYGSFTGQEVEVGPTPPVDLTIQTLTVDAAQTRAPLTPGAYLPIDVNVHTTAPEYRWADLRLALSTDDAAGNADDILIATVATPATNAASPPRIDTGPMWLRLPEGIAPGAYRLLALVDPADEVGETDETNNAALGPLVQVVPADAVPAPPASPIPTTAPDTPTPPAASNTSTATTSLPPAQTARPAPAARLVAKVVSVHRAGKLVRVLRLANAGNATYRGIATLHVAHAGAIKRKLTLRAGRHVDLTLPSLASLRHKSVRVDVRP